MARKKLGEMLIEAGVIDETALRSALADQRRWGRTLGRTLVELRLVDEDMLVQVLAKQLNLDRVDLDQQRAIPPEVLAMVPVDLVRSAQVVPFRTVMKFLDVAMGDPTNVGILDELRIRTQLNIRPFLCGPRQIERAIRHYYSSTRPGQHSAEIPLDAYDMMEATVPTNRGKRPTGAPQGPLPRAQSAPVIPVTTSARAANPTRPPRAEADAEGLRPFPHPGTSLPPSSSGPGVGSIATGASLRTDDDRDAEIQALQTRISRLEALVARDEDVLRKVLALLVDKGLATRDEIVERLG